jgi:hypothetical protein
VPGVAAVARNAALSADVSHGCPRKDGSGAQALKEHADRMDAGTCNLALVTIMLV